MAALSPEEEDQSSALPGGELPSRIRNDCYIKGIDWSVYKSMDVKDQITLIDEQVSHLLELKAELLRLQSPSTFTSRSSAPRHSIPAYVLGGMFRMCSPNNVNFHKRMGITYPVWRKFVCDPLVARLKEKERFKRAIPVLPHEFRVWRFWLRLRGESEAALADVTGQSVSTVSRDFVRILDEAIPLVDVWVKPFVPGSESYQQHRGVYGFRHNIHSVYAADGTRVFIPKPVRDEFMWYSDKYKSHAVIMICACDSVGLGRWCLGPAPLSFPENFILKKSSLAYKTNGLKGYVLSLHFRFGSEMFDVLGTIIDCWRKETTSSLTVECLTR